MIAALRISLALLFLGASRPVASGVAQTVLNPGFEEGREVAGQILPDGWSSQGAAHDLMLDTVNAFDGRSSLRSRYTLDIPRPPDRIGIVSQIIPPGLALGRALRLTGWMRTEDVGEGSAGFWMRVDGPGQPGVAYENTGFRPIRGTTPWTRYAIELPVDSGAVQVVVGALHAGTGTVWFDSVTIEVVGLASPRSVSAESPYVVPPRREEDLTRLLTDAELALIPDPDAPNEDPAWSEWVRQNARPIRSLGADDFSDLDFLEILLEGKRIVQLGESGHGVREFNLAKVRLIRYLHERLGYDVIAFESSLFECDRAGRVPSAPADAAILMRSCIYGVWYTEELVPLFEYIRETERSERPLRLTGVDIQTSSGRASARSAFLRDLIATIDTAYARSVYERNTAVHLETLPAYGGGVGGLPPAERDSLVAFYDGLADWLGANEAQLVRNVPEDPDAPLVARQTAISMALFIRMVAAGRSVAATEVRDRGMADNLDFLADVLYPARKIIVWAHNAHIQHRGYGGGSVRVGQERMMGTHVAERRRAEVYTVGLYMYRGLAAMNNRQVYRIRENATGSLESILHRSLWRYSFMDLSKAEYGPGTSWMFQSILAKEWGTYSSIIVPRDEYDAILFIDATSPPDYLP